VLNNENEMADVIKAKRLAKLKKLNKKLSAADVVVNAIQSDKEQRNDDRKEDDGITFELDPTKEFTRTMRATTVKKEQESDVPDSSTEAPKPILDDNNNEEEVDIHKLAEEIKVENDEEEEPVFGTNQSVGRGLSSVLSLFQTTGDISTTNNPHASKEKLRGRAKDERHYDDYSNLDLRQTVKLNSNQEKDQEFANRQIKLDYRDEHGRLLTRKEAFRQMCYQFHGYGSFNKTKEKRLKAMQREQAMESSDVLKSGDGNGSTLGVLKKMQEVTGKAFVVHKT